MRRLVGWIEGSMTAEATLTPTTAAGQRFVDGDSPKWATVARAERAKIAIAIEREAAAAAVDEWLTLWVTAHLSSPEGMRAGTRLAAMAEDRYAAQGREYPLPRIARSLQDPDPRLTEQEQD